MSYNNTIIEEINEDHVLRFLDENTGKSLIWLKKPTSRIRGFVAIHEFEEYDRHTNTIHRRFRTLKFYDDQLTAIREICRRFGPENPVGIRIGFEILDKLE